MSYRYSKQKIQTFTKQIRNKECTFSTAKSTGPGGQNVNKRETKVQLYRDYASSEVLPKSAYIRFKEMQEQDITHEGIFRMDAQVHRTQDANKKLLEKKFTRMIADAFKPPTVRKTTKPPKHVTEKRLSEKKKKSKLRASRTPIVSYR